MWTENFLQFCLEGLGRCFVQALLAPCWYMASVTMLVASLSYFFMHDVSCEIFTRTAWFVNFHSQYPSTATFLTPHEKKLLVQILKDDTLGLATHYDMKFVWQALLDYKSYVLALLYTCTLIPVYAIALFLPTIINAMGEYWTDLRRGRPYVFLGFSAATAQLLTIPPFAIGCVATIIGCILYNTMSDESNFISSSWLLFRQASPSWPLCHRFLCCRPHWVYCPYYAVKGRCVLRGSRNCRCWRLSHYCCHIGLGRIRRGWWRTKRSAHTLPPYVSVWRMILGVTFAIVIGFGNLGGWVTLESNIMNWLGINRVCSSFIYLKAPRFFVGHGTIIGFLTLG